MCLRCDSADIVLQKFGGGNVECRIFYIDNIFDYQN